MQRQFILQLMVFAFFVMQMSAAQGQNKNIAEMNEALANGQIETADSLLQSTIEFYVSAKQPDSLVNYIYILGRISHAKAGRKTCEEKIELLIERIKNLTSNPATIRQGYIEVGEFYGSIGLNELGYNANELALKYTLLIPDKTGAQQGIIENNLAVYAQRMGDFNMAQAHSRKALIHNLRDSKPDTTIWHCKPLKKLSETQSTSTTDRQ